jgi:hypothetical protein
VLTLGVASDNWETTGKNPNGVVRIRQDLNDTFYVEYEHISSIPLYSDYHTIDQVGIYAQFELWNK